MRTLATGSRRSDAGVSLVEAMVALMIVGMVAGAAVLLAPGPERRTREAAERLGAHVTLAAEESIIRNRTLALSVTAEGYGFAALEDGAWVELERTSPLGFRAWPSEVDIRVERPDPEDGVGRVLFDPLGGVTPASILISGSGARWRVDVDGQGLVHVAATD